MIRRRRYRALLLLLALLGSRCPAAAQEDAGTLLGRVIATFAGAEICGYPLPADQRHELAAAGLRLQGEARISNAELERLFADIGSAIGRDVCERGRAGYAAATDLLIAVLRARPAAR